MVCLTGISQLRGFISGDLLLNSGFREGARSKFGPLCWAPGRVSSFRRWLLLVSRRLRFEKLMYSQHFKKCFVSIWLSRGFVCNI